MRIKLSIWAGNGLVLSFLMMGIVATMFSPGDVLAALIAWVLLGVGSHCPVHYIVGRLCGVRFTHYVLAPSALERMDVPLVSRIAKTSVLPGLRIDRKSLHGVGRRCIYFTLTSGAIASMAVPWTVTLVQAIGGDPLWIVTAILQAFRVLFTLRYSPRGGDLYRARVYADRYA